MRTHGRISTYQAGCRCEVCREVASDKRRSYRMPTTRRRNTSVGFPGAEDPMPWADRAACRDTSTAVFFSNAFTRAKAVCAECGVQQECLAYALRTDQPEGVWGGLTTPERHRRSERMAG